MKPHVSALNLPNRGEDGIGDYFTRINHYQTLTLTEECALAMQYQQNGDQSALDRLVKANLRFVVSVARTFMGNGLPFADLIEEGNIGLIEAAKHYDGTRGYKLISYAVQIIERHIRSAIFKVGKFIHRPKDQQLLINRISRFENDFFLKNGYRPEISDIAEALEASEEDVAHAIEYSETSCCSLDISVGDDSDGYMRELISGDEQTDAHMLNEEQKNNLLKALDVLKPRNKKVLIMYFGLNGVEPMLTPTIGIHLGLSAQRVQQIIKQSLEKLRKNDAIQSIFLAA